MQNTHTFPANISHENNFDFLRFLLAVSVIFSHSYVLWGSMRYHDSLFSLTNGQLDFGSLAVAGFFALSGFLVTNSWLRSQSPVDYLKKRTLRIFPGLITAILFGILVAGPLGGADMHTYWHSLITRQHGDSLLHSHRMFTLPGVFAHNPYPTTVNGSLGTIKYELLCYLLVVAAGMLSLLRRPGLLLAALAIVILSAHVLQADVQSYLLWFYSLPRLLSLASYFMAGMVFYLYRDRVPVSPLLAAVSLLVLVLAHQWGMDLALPIFGAYLLFFTAYSPRLRLQNFGRYGDFSYGLYVYAFPIQQLLMYHFGPHLSPLSLFGYALAISLVIAILSWHFIEHPFLQLKSSRKHPNVVMPAPEPAGAIL